MSGSTFGNIFKITTWGESHGKGVGVVIDGCPAGIPLDEEYIQKFLNRRKPGQTKYSTPRKENDLVTIQSGVFEGRTTGTPISLAIYNETQRSGDYSEIASYYRPGHADFTFDAKYGFRDYRGGGRSSGRETIGRVAAGAVACALLEALNIHVFAYSKSIGPITCAADTDVFATRDASPLYMPDLKASEQAEQYLMDTMQNLDSAGGIIECIVTGCPAGLGDPTFDKLDANLAKAIFSIGSVKGFEIGSGFEAATMHGSENNDAFLGVKTADGSEFKPESALDEAGRSVTGDIAPTNLHAVKRTNNAGGILGGISDGDTIIFRAAIKPTPSIAATQQTIRRTGEPIDINIKGRHDPIIVPRAVVVVESMAALTIADALLENMSSRIEGIKKFYELSRKDK